MKAAIYTRVSTTKQANERSLDDQLAACRAYAAERGWTVVREYSEAISGWSGKERPQFAQAQLDAKDGKYDVLLVDSFDRVTRDTGRKGLIYLSIDFEPVEVVSVAPGETLSDDPMLREMMLVVHGALAHQESQRKSARAKRGTASRVARGLPPGRLPVGYKLDGDGADTRMVVDPDRAGVVRRIFREWNDGKSQQAIARGLEADGVATSGGGKHWTQAAVRAVLMNDAYLGTKWNCDPLVSDDDWRAAQSRLTGPTGRPGGRDSQTHLLSRMLRCTCGEVMLVRKERAYEVYFCPRASGRVPGECDVKPLRRDLVDSTVVEHFAQHAVDLDATKRTLAAQRQEVVDELTVTLSNARRVVKLRTDAVERVRRDYAAGELTAAEWRELKSQLDAERDEAQATVESLQERLSAAETAPDVDLDAYVADALEGLRVGRDVPQNRARLQRVFSGFQLSRDGDSLPTVDGLALVPVVRPELVQQAVERLNDWLLTTESGSTTESRFHKLGLPKQAETTWLRAIPLAA